LVDRAQCFSVTCQTLCGFVPRTHCGEAVAAETCPGDALPQITVDPVYDVGPVPTGLEVAPEGYRRRFPQEAP
jgi:hypothetical protein